MSRFQVIKGGEVLGMGIADYVWVQDNNRIRWKKKSVLLTRNEQGDYIPILDRWTGGEDNNKVVLVPCHYLPDPTRPQPHFIVLCEARDLHDQPAACEQRSALRKALETAGEHGRLTWFGFAQPYTLRCHNDPNTVIGDADWVAERHFGACFDAGLLLHSMQPGDFKVGVRDFPHDIDPDPPGALVVSDHLIMARHLLIKVALEKNLFPDFGTPRLYVSTAALREPGANTESLIEPHVDLLSEGEMWDKLAVCRHPTRGHVQSFCVRHRHGLSSPYILSRYVLQALQPR